MFETNMDEYLDEEVESLKHVFETICTGWDREVSHILVFLPCHLLYSLQYLSKTTQSEEQQHQQPRFLTSQNPAQVKRNVLASFTSVLLLPVTIVPRTMGAVGTGIGEMLRIGGGQKGNGVNEHVSTTGWGSAAASSKGGKPADHTALENESDGEGETVFEVGVDDDDDEDEDEKQNAREDVIVDDPWAQTNRGGVNGGEF
jgi:recyclin-1